MILIETDGRTSGDADMQHIMEWMLRLKLVNMVYLPVSHQADLKSKINFWNVFEAYFQGRITFGGPALLASMSRRAPTRPIARPTLASRLPKLAVESIGLLEIA